jgi:hypothetical protein
MSMMAPLLPRTMSSLQNTPAVAHWRRLDRSIRRRLTAWLPRPVNHCKMRVELSPNPDFSARLALRPL